MTGTIQNRDKFLAKIASEFKRNVQIEGVTRPSLQDSINWKTLADKPNEELIVIFKQQCELIHTKVVDVKKEHLTQIVLEEIAAFNGGNLLLSDDERFMSSGIDKALKTQGLPIYIWGNEAGRTNIEKAEAANIGICFAEYALAESGTVVTASNAGHGRAFDMLPQHFITIVEKEKIVPRSTQAVFDLNRRVEAGETLPSALHFISGPSNSADIEMELVVGVHGPLNMTYILV
ncbi:lactate utilization protein C [Listeria sp. PSOL-1]|uniref:LutC/YkgG family protein n=1 Tax=Listeria sp. PSOL-1 TaxID=1844999 RepID=UPI0013D145CC|nr:lactate utilization protein C [Listeria sp. PSOL-1]